VSISFLTPLAASVGLVVALAIFARVRAQRRAAEVSAQIGLPPAGRGSFAVDVVLLSLVGILVAAAAAQPVMSRSEVTPGRDGAEILMVFDVTRSMLAQRAPSEPTRLDRSRALAKRVRASIPDTRFGVASLTDRVLPHLFPTLGSNSFVAVVNRAIGIERPPPDRRANKATAFSALGDIGRTAFFRRETQHRVVVVVSDGETLPVDLEVLRERLGEGRISTIFVQVWRGDEAVFDASGERDPAYRPDRTGGRTLRRVAGALEAPVYNEGDVRGIVEALRERIGTGTQVPQGRQVVSHQLAPHALVAAFFPLALILYRRNLSAT
jgi:VWA domain-containing protein